MELQMKINSKKLTKIQNTLIWRDECNKDEVVV